jgi:hypothetical protein
MGKKEAFSMGKKEAFPMAELPIARQVQMGNFMTEWP